VARVPEYLNIGNRDNIDLEELLKIVERAYTDLATALNQKPDFVERDTLGQTTDTFLSQGTLNLDTTTNTIEMLTSHDTASTVTWTALN